MLKRVLPIVLIAVSFSYPVTLKFKCSLPAVNWLYLESEDKKQSEIGSWLMGIGCEWHCPKTLWFALNTDILTTCLVPVLPTELRARDGLSEISVSAQAGMRFNRISFGAGPLNGRMYHVKTESVPSSHNGIRHVYSASIAGLILSGDFQFTDLIFLGLNYRPNIYNLSYGKFDYSHSLSLSLILKLSRNK